MSYGCLTIGMGILIPYIVTLLKKWHFQEVMKITSYHVVPWLLFHFRLDIGRTRNHGYLMVPEEHHPLSPFAALLIVKYESQLSLGTFS